VASTMRRSSENSQTSDDVSASPNPLRPSSRKRSDRRSASTGSEASRTSTREEEEEEELRQTAGIANAHLIQSSNPPTPEIVDHPGLSRQATPPLHRMPSASISRMPSAKLVGSALTDAHREIALAGERRSHDSARSSSFERISAALDPSAAQGVESAGSVRSDEAETQSGQSPATLTRSRPSEGRPTPVSVPQDAASAAAAASAASAAASAASSPTAGPTASPPAGGAGSYSFGVLPSGWSSPLAPPPLAPGVSAATSLGVGAESSVDVEFDTYQKKTRMRNVRRLLAKGPTFLEKLERNRRGHRRSSLPSLKGVYESMQVVRASVHGLRDSVRERIGLGEASVSAGASPGVAATEEGGEEAHPERIPTRSDKTSLRGIVRGVAVELEGHATGFESYQYADDMSRVHLEVRAHESEGHQFKVLWLELSFVILIGFFLGGSRVPPSPPPPASFSPARPPD
jgi:hypothetical protein